MPAPVHPFTGFNFVVEFDGVRMAGFVECSGLSNETDVLFYREGGDRSSSFRALPGLTRHARIVLRRGITADRALWEWRKTVIDGQVQRRDGAIILLSPDGAPVVRWMFRNAWPAKWEGPTLAAGSSDVAIETIELVHEGLDYESV